MKKIRLSIILAMILSLFATVVAAQDNVNNSIRGGVYLDEDGDGDCSDGAGVEGITISFKSEDGLTEVFLQSGANGTYGLVDVGLSNWTVTLQPNADWVATTSKTTMASVWAETPVVTDVNFCVAKAGTVSTTSNTVLPQSGAHLGDTAATSPLIFVVMVGLSLIAAGVAVEFRRRQNQ